MRDHVRSLAPEEACGLVAGVDGKSTQVLPVENKLHSPVRFRMEPNQQIKAYLSILDQGLELVAIYHSHPAGPDHPSLTDIEEAAYPEAASLIWFRSGLIWSCRGYTIHDKHVDEIEIKLQLE